MTAIAVTVEHTMGQTTFFTRLRVLGGPEFTLTLDVCGAGTVGVTVQLKDIDGSDDGNGTGPVGSTIGGKSVLEGGVTSATGPRAASWLCLVHIEILRNSTKLDSASERKSEALTVDGFVTENGDVRVSGLPRSVTQTPFDSKVLVSE